MTESTPQAVLQITYLLKSGNYEMLTVFSFFMSLRSTIGKYTTLGRHCFGVCVCVCVCVYVLCRVCTPCMAFLAQTKVRSYVYERRCKKTQYIVREFGVPRSMAPTLAFFSSNVVEIWRYFITYFFIFINLDCFRWICFCCLYCLCYFILDLFYQN